jgi:hypothetical protein
MYVGRESINLKLMNKYGLQRPGYWGPIIVVCVVRLYDGASPGFVLRVCKQVTFAYGISTPVTYYIALATSQFSTQEMSARGKLTGSAPPPSSRASRVIRSFLNFIYFRHAATVIVALPSVHQRSSHPTANTLRSNGSVERRFVQMRPVFALLTWVILKYDVSPTWSVAGYH